MSDEALRIDYYKTDNLVSSLNYLAYVLELTAVQTVIGRALRFYDELPINEGGKYGYSIQRPDGHKYFLDRKDPVLFAKTLKHIIPLEESFKLVSGNSKRTSVKLSGIEKDIFESLRKSYRALSDTQILEHVLGKFTEYINEARMGSAFFHKERGQEPQRFILIDLDLAAQGYPITTPPLPPVNRSGGRPAPHA